MTFKSSLLLAIVRLLSSCLHQYWINPIATKFIDTLIELKIIILSEITQIRNLDVISFLIFYLCILALNPRYVCFIWNTHRGQEISKKT